MCGGAGAGVLALPGLWRGPPPLHVSLSLLSVPSRNWSTEGCVLTATTGTDLLNKGHAGP